MRNPRIVIVGAGFGGLGVAFKLRAAGYRNVTIFEREADIGGTWFLNTYPGAACDAPSHLYSYSFAQDVDWSRRFAPAPEIHAYLRRCVDEGGIADLVQTGSEVVAAEWTGRDWVVKLADGRRERADILVPAVGQLSVPAIPELPGLDTFSGPAFHTARWRHDLDLTDKRIGVVGTGASAIQVVPAIAMRAKHVTVFQRTAPYVFTKSDIAYRARLNRRYRALPTVKAGVRQAIWAYFELVTSAFTRWNGALDILRRVHNRQLRSKIPDTALRDKLRPNYRPGCKRILISDDYYATLMRPDVTLETARIERVTDTAIVSEAGTHPVDVIVFGTGFQTTPFVPTMSIVGRDRVSLSDAWAERPAAFLGISVPGFPNMFLVYGPNTNLGSGSIVYMLESQANHIVEAIRAITRCGGTAAIEVKEQAYREFVGELAAHQTRTVWQGCGSWYQDEQGRDTHNWPWLMTTYRRRTRRIRTADYLVAALDDTSR